MNAGAFLFGDVNRIADGLYRKTTILFSMLQLSSHLTTSMQSEAITVQFVIIFFNRRVFVFQDFVPLYETKLKAWIVVTSWAWATITRCAGHSIFKRFAEKHKLMIIFKEN